MTPKRLPLFARITIPIVSILVFLVFTEIVLRLAGVDTYFQNRFFVLNRAIDYPEIFERDHDLFWKLRPNRTVSSHFFIGRTYRINSYGLNNPPIAPRTDRTRIITMGNSCTFGWGVAFEKSYPRVLQKDLGSAYDVVNAGIPGYTSFQGKRFYRDVLSGLHPNIVTVLFAFNDHWAAAGDIPDKDQKLPPQWVLDIQNDLSELHTYRLLKKLILSTVEPSPDSLYNKTHPVYRVGPEDFRENLIEICRMVRHDSAVPILLTSPIPSLEKYFPPGYKSNLHAYHAMYNDIIRSVAAEENCGLVDLAKEFDHYSGLFDDPMVDPIHFNTRGHDLAGRLIAEYIESHGL